MRNFSTSPVLYLALFFALFGHFSGAPALAQALVPGDDISTVNILQDVEYLRDPSGKLSLKDLQRPSADKAFRSYNRSHFLSSDPDAVHWFRFDAQASSRAPYRATVYFTDPRLEKVTLFRQVMAANADVFSYDSAREVSDAVATQGGIGLPLWIETGERRTIYFAMQGADLSGALELWDPKALTDHLRVKAIWHYIAYGFLVFATCIGIFSVSKLGRRTGLALAAACLSFAAFLFLGHTALALPKWLGPLNVSLLFAALFSASALRVVVNTLRHDSPAPYLGWWSIVLGVAIVIAALLSFVMPAPAILFNYVLTVAIVIASLFCAIALLTLKSASSYQLAALQAVLLAICIALTPAWPFDLRGLGIIPIILPPLVLLLSGLFLLQGRRQETGAVVQSSSNEAPVNSDQGDMLSAFPVIEKPSPTSMAKVNVETASTKSAASDIQADLQAVAARPDALDEMTGVFNAVTIDALGQKTIAQVRRYGRHHTAIMLRIADYEDILTDLGQPTSDRAVKLLAVTSMRDLRESDALGRVRADTFVALLPETDLPGAYNAMARMKSNLVERTLPTRAGMRKLKVTFSASSVDSSDDRFAEIVTRLEAELTSDIPRPGSSDASSQAAE